MENQPKARIVIPARYAAWLHGDLGRAIESNLQVALSVRLQGPFTVSRLPRAFLVESVERAGVALEACKEAADSTEAAATVAYPVFSQELGPIFTGTLQAVYA